MMNTPAAREELYEIANSLLADGDPRGDEIISVIETYMHKSQAVYRAPTKCPKPTVEDERKMVEMYKTTDMSQMEVATVLGFNQGRMSTAWAKYLRGDLVL